MKITCPIPPSRYPRIVLAHGGGGRLMRGLIEGIFAEAFGPSLSTETDSAVLDRIDGAAAFTTDSFVVRPIFFPGGDIGRLAVNGTVNDLAMAGAVPIAISVGMIIEEGFPVEDLRRIAFSISEAAAEAKAPVVTGDTKVVEKGKGDGIYINTSGVGRVPPGLEISPRSVREGDAVIISGDIGRHGATIMMERMGFSGKIESDTAPLARPVAAMIEAGIGIRMLRDPTRGGLSAALNEIASSAGLEISIEEERMPVSGVVRATAEALGLDPLHLASEGRFVAIVRGEDSERAVEVLRRLPVTAGAAAIGKTRAGEGGRVVVRNSMGMERIVDLLSGEELPRIC